MKTIQKLGFMLLFAAATVSAQAQTADDIINKHIEAIGGKEKLSAINSVRMESSMSVMGQEAPATSVVVNGKGARSDVSFNGQTITQVYTDKGGWGINPMTGQSAPQAMPSEQYEAAQDQIWIVPLMNYKANGYTAELQGKEKVGNVDAYKVRVVKGSNGTTYYFDPTTYYLVRQVKSAEMMGQQIDVVTTYSDYRKSDIGWLMPYAASIDMGGQMSMDMKVNKVEINPTVDPAVFVMKQ